MNAWFTLHDFSPNFPLADSFLELPDKVPDQHWFGDCKFADAAQTSSKYLDLLGAPDTSYVH